MKKHKNIPKTATWNKEDKEWEQGEKDKAGKNIGVWNNWHEDGHLCGITDYGNGNPPFLFKRFHPDGTLAQEGNWHGGQIWLGTFRFINTDKPTPEGFPKRARENGIVWIAEFDYITPGIYNAQRYYDKKNRPVSVAGAP